MESDLLGGAAREPLRTAAAALLSRLWAVRRAAHPASDIAALQAGCVAAEEGAASHRDAAQLDSGLRQVAAALRVPFPRGAPPPSRLDCLEAAVAAVQAGAAELAAAPPPAAAPAATSPAAASISARAAATSQALRELASVLGVPPAQPSAAALVAALRARCAAALVRLPPGLFEAVAPPGALGEAGEARLRAVDGALREEYRLRRRMLVERAAVTLHSFLSSPRLEGGAAREAAQAAADEVLRVLRAQAGGGDDDDGAVARRAGAATLGDLLTVTQRAAGGGGGDGGAAPGVKGVLIGAVPDRGGRRQGKARAADMPAWKARAAGGVHKG